MVIVIRPATVNDVRDIARIQIATWRTTYAGLVPDNFLASLNEEHRANGWRASLLDGGEYIFMAEKPGVGAVGFVSGGPERDGTPGYDAELYAIYILNAAQGEGIGRKLAEAIARRLHGAGYRAMLLWVLKDNLPARAFYERLGGRYIREKTIHIGSEVTEVAYGWPDITALYQPTPPASATLP
jgi:ribosomal protein S18 acetylase RimI-like enzyme